MFIVTFLVGAHVRCTMEIPADNKQDAQRLFVDSVQEDFLPYREILSIDQK